MRPESNLKEKMHNTFLPYSATSSDTCCADRHATIELSSAQAL